MTVPQIILRAEISEYLAVNAIYKGGIWGGGTPSYLPSLIRQVRISVSRVYDLEPSNDYLTGNANYLLTLCGKFGLYASYLISSGGSIPSPTNTLVYGYPIASSYTALADGETTFTLLDADGNSLPTGTRITWVMKSIQPLSPNDYSYVYPTFELLNGISMSLDEVLSFQYVVPV